MSSTDRHISTCLHLSVEDGGGGGNLFSQGVGWVGAGGHVIQRCLLVDGVEAVSGRGTLWPWEISV